MNTPGEGLFQYDSGAVVLITAQANDWLQSRSELPGDLNRDGTVNAADVVLPTEDWLEQTSWYEP